LSESDFEAIARIMLDELKTSLAEKNILFKYSSEAVRFIAKNSYSYKFGARNMRRFIQSNVEDLIADKIISDYEKKIVGVALKYSRNENKLTVECI
jgi:ATP-dependent Clp protease ATP-binding subunit ClpA